MDRCSVVVLNLFLCVVVGVVEGQVYFQPEQIHLSYGDDATKMVVTWVTESQTNTTVVEYGRVNFTATSKGVEEKFVDGGSQKRASFMHRVLMTGLEPGTEYIYHVGGPLGWSSVYTFRAMKQGTNWAPRFAVFGDMGNKNARILGRLQEETMQGHFDAILHVGDFAYDLDTNNALVGDAFMNQVQSVAAYIPYMTCVGNHENAYNFSNYASRFTMPNGNGGDGHNMFYSFNVGPAHIVAFSSEYYYYVNYGWMQIANQYKWLENDLREANKPENRAQRPWIISMCHRPLYCSNNDDPTHCTNVENTIRVGLPYIHAYGIEDLLYKYGVDLHFTAHEHSYERMWPVYNLTVCNGSTEDPYHNPPATVHIVTGSGGDQEGQDPFEKIPQPWSAFHTDDYGFTRMTIYNDTHLGLEQVSEDKGGQVVDEMTLVKTEQAPFSCHKQQSKHPPYKMPPIPNIKSNGNRKEYHRQFHAMKRIKSHIPNVL